MNVSLIIRTRNEEAHIAHCLEALVSQTCQPKEVLIVDNLSTDNTREIAKTFSATLPIKIIDNPIIGFASGLEIGVRVSLYDYVAFLSADVIPEKDWLYDLIDFMSKNDCAIVKGFEKPYPENDIHYVLESESPQPTHPLLIKFFNNTNTLYNKSILKEFMPFKGVGEYLYGEDTLMALDYASKGYKAYLLPTVVHHAMFTSESEFKIRLYQHAKSSVNLFLARPLHPRVYLNAFYWVIIELYMSIRKRDIRFLRIAYWRLSYSLQGMIVGWLDVIRGKSK